jgi:hypothetical protein
MRPSVFFTDGLFSSLYITETKTHIRRKKCVITNIVKMKIVLVIHVNAQKNNVAVNNYKRIYNAYNFGKSIRVRWVSST